MRVHNPLNVKHFHKGLAGNAREFSLKSRIGEVSLLSKGWQLARMHDLEALLNQALTYDPSVELFRPACQKITGFYMIERYPFIIEATVTEEDVRQSWEQVNGLIERLRRETRVDRDPPLAPG